MSALSPPLPSPWWDVMLSELRQDIALTKLDFISLVALALTSWRSLRETQLARGLRMAHPDHPERMPRTLPGKEDGKWTVYYLYRRGIRHVGLIADFMLRRVTTSCDTAYTMNGIFASTIHDSLEHYNEEATNWFLSSFPDLNPFDGYWLLRYVETRIKRGHEAALERFHRLLPRAKFPRRMLLSAGAHDAEAASCLIWAINNLCEEEEEQ